MCLLAVTKLSTSDCLLKLESNAGGGLWSSRDLSSRTRNDKQRSSSCMILAERYDRCGDEVYKRWAVNVRLGAEKRLLDIGFVTGSAALLVSMVYCWLNQELSLECECSCSSEACGGIFACLALSPLLPKTVAVNCEVDCDFYCKLQA